MIKTRGTYTLNAGRKMTRRASIEIVLKLPEDL